MKSQKWSVVLAVLCTAFAAAASEYPTLPCEKLPEVEIQLPCGASAFVSPVDYPEAAEMTEETYAEQVFPSKPSDYESEVVFRASVSESDMSAVVAVDVGAFRRNRARDQEYRDRYVYALAQVGAEPAVAPPPPRPGILVRTGQTIQEQFEQHPIRSTLATIALVLFADYQSGGGINGFGALSSGSSGSGGSANVDATSARAETSGESSPGTVIKGDNNTVTQIINAPPPAPAP